MEEAEDKLISGAMVAKEQVGRGDSVRRAALRLRSISFTEHCTKLEEQACCNNQTGL